MCYARSYATNHGELCKTADNGTHVVLQPIMVKTCMINALKGNVCSYATNKSGLCMATDNGTHVVMLLIRVNFD